MLVQLALMSQGESEIHSSMSNEEIMHYQHMCCMCWARTDFVTGFAKTSYRTCEFIKINPSIAEIWVL